MKSFSLTSWKNWWVRSLVIGRWHLWGGNIANRTKGSRSSPPLVRHFPARMADKPPPHPPGSPFSRPRHSTSSTTPGSSAFRISMKSA